jgi:hypothetical protein
MRSCAAATAATEEAEHAELARALLTLRTWALRCKPALHARMFAGFGVCSRRPLTPRCRCSLERWVHAANCSADACLRFSWRSSTCFP